MKEVTKITVNGREYDSIEHMPPDVREMYLQAMAALRGGQTGGLSSLLKNNIVSKTVQESIVYNGREYKSRDELPPEARALLDQMPEPSADAPASEVLNIETVTTSSPQLRFTESPAARDDRPERDPTLAWLLVSVLVVAVMVLLFLLYLSGIRHR